MHSHSVSIPIHQGVNLFIFILSLSKNIDRAVMLVELSHSLEVRKKMHTGITEYKKKMCKLARALIETPLSPSTSQKEQYI